MTLDLKPCPFCGSDAEISSYETESLWSSEQVTYTKVSCSECDIAFQTEPGHATQSIAAWNRRALSTVAPDEVGGLVDARSSLWVPARPEHAKVGWTYDFEQTERIARAAYDSTGYDATMEVVEFVMAEADRRHRDALTTERAAYAETDRERDEAHDREMSAVIGETEATKRAEAYRAQRDEAMKSLEPIKKLADAVFYVDEDGREMNASKPDDAGIWGFNNAMLTYGDLRAARRVREGGKADG